MFYNEVTILKKLKHPGIIEMIEIYEGSSTFYIIFEFLKG
jgi:serine/threonine protein kinase